MREGASENGATATSLLEHLVERGVDPQRRYLFMIDGSKALCSAIDKVFGKGSSVQEVSSPQDWQPDEVTMDIQGKVE